MSSSRYSDLLGNDPARPQTTLPGRWILELPSSDSETEERPLIHIRRFRATPSAPNDAAGPSTRRDHSPVPDSLETARRSIVEQATGVTAGSLQSSPTSLEQPSGAITSELIGEVQERVLWVFSINADEVPMADGLQEIEPKLPPIDIPNLLICSNHGRNPSCFDSRPEPQDNHDHHHHQTRSCEITLESAEQARRNLELLGAAIAERMAWKAGWRLCLQPALGGVIPPLSTTLRPISRSRLLLSLTPSSRPSCSNLSILYPLHLNPIRLPALRISDLTPSSMQESRLSASFDQTLGHTWKNGRQEAFTRARLLGDTYAEWSIYWVPLIEKQDILSSKQAGKMSPRQLCERWRQCSGVLTIWPTHLSETYYTNSALPSLNPVGLSNIQGETKSSDLLDIASGVFNFLSNYREPEVVDEVEDDPEPVEEDVTMDGESNFGPTSITDDIDMGNNRSPQSDIDDLFSAHSDSPLNVNEDPPLTIKPPSPLTIDHRNTNIIHNPSDEKMVEAVDYEPPPAPVRREQRNEAEEKPEQREEIMVTEDDFAFFDSPSDQVEMPPAVEPADSVGIVNGDGAVVHDGMDIDLDEIFGGTINGFSNGIDTVTEQPAPNPEPAEGMLPIPSDVPDVHRELESQQPISASEVKLPVVMTSSDENPIPSQPIQLPPSPALSFHKRTCSSTDLIPPSFSPLPLLPSRSAQKFDYSLPSPAPTPSSLREDLVERLKPPKPKNATYADVWELDSEPSEMDEEEEYTGPPTPESAYSDESEAEVRPVEKKVGEEDTNEFGGTKCIFTEWLEYVYLPENVRALAKQWDSSWITTSLPSTIQEERAASPAASAAALKGIDCVRYVRDLITNRASQTICAGQAYETGGQLGIVRGVTQDLVDRGIVLSDLCEDNTAALAQPQIHAGYSASVIKIAISSLHYWTEIGLQPQGGPKEVEAVIVSSKEEVSAGASGHLSSEMKRAWESLRLGKHTISELAGNSRGVVSVSDSSAGSGIPEAVADLLNQVSRNTVIYILLPPAASSIASIIRGLYSLALSPSSSAVIRLIPHQALSQEMYREIAIEVYDALPVPIRPISHTALDPNLDIHPDQGKVAPLHAFTLARSELPEPEFSMSWPLKSYDVLNTQRSIHGYYTIVEEFDVMIACVMDDLGEALELNVWQEVGKMEVKSRVKKVFEWFKTRAEEWIIQWKGSVTRIGTLSLDEIRAWNMILDNLSSPLTFLVVDDPSHSPDESISLLPRPRGLANIPPAMMNDHNSTLIDLSLSAQLTTLSARIPLALHSTRQGEGNLAEQTDIIYPQSCFLLTCSDEMGHGSLSTLYNIINHSKGSRSEPLKKRKESNQKLGEELYRLNCLIRKRYGLEGMAGMLDLAERGLRGLSSGMDI
ncbi:hypothetical protein IAT40_002058 [Kwoniella sp. CBS 6097]